MAFEYQKIATALREDIVAGRLASGARLPTRRALSERFGVSEITVRRAVAELEAQGWVEGQRGRGRSLLVHRSEFPSSDGRNWPRRISIVSLWPFSGNTDSDLPALLYSLIPALHELNFGVELLPCQNVNDMLGILKLWNARTRPDGLIILPAIISETLRLIRAIRKYGQQYILLTSSQWHTPIVLRQKKLPGIFVNELSALRRLTATAKKAGIGTILLVGCRNEALLRMRMLLEMAGDESFRVEIRDLNIPTYGGAPAGMLSVVRAAAENPRWLLLLEGDLEILVMFECALRFSRLTAGKDISVAFFQHYCDLNAAYAERYSSITRRYDRIGETAARLMARMLREGGGDGQQILDADYNDVGTIATGDGRNKARGL